MRGLGTLLLLGLCVGVAPSLRASVAFSSGGTTCGSSICYSASGLNVTATGLSATFTNVNTASPSVGTLSTTGTSITQYSGYGLGVCDPSDPGCGYPEHAIDNNGGRVDFVLLQLSAPLSSISLTLNPFYGYPYYTPRDMDATVITGYCATSACFSSLLSGQTPTAAGLATLTAIPGMSYVSSFDNCSISNCAQPGSAGTTNNVTLTLTGVGTGVNWILVGATTQSYYGDTSSSKSPDYFKLNAMSYTVGSSVPEPATFGMAGAALLGLGLLRARKKRSAAV